MDNTASNSSLYCASQTAGSDQIQLHKSHDRITHSSQNKSPSNSSTQNITLKNIWEGITSNRVKETPQIIEIVEQKSYISRNSSNPNTTDQNPIQNLQTVRIKVTSEPLITDTISNPISTVPSVQTQIIKPKDDQFTKGIKSYHSLYLEQLIEQKENDRIHQEKIIELFQECPPNDNKAFYKEIQLKAIDKLLHYSDKIKGLHLIRLVDILYKKYILKPSKQVLMSQSNSKVYNIYKPEPVRGQRSYKLKDDSLNFGNNLSNSQISQNSFKRINPAQKYQQNFVSLVDNDSTNQNNEYLEAIASNYVNGIRKYKPTDDQNSNRNFSTFPPKQSMIPSDKYRKYGPASQFALPFDIQIPEQSSRKQFNPGYNIYHGPDDEKNERFDQQRLVAKTFVKDGYGLQIVRNYMGQQVDGGTYNRAITTIIRQSYKRIEDFLSKQCNVKIHSLTSSEFSLVKTPLVHCRNILRPEDLRTFFKYIAITYKFGKLKPDDYPTAQQTLSLYNAILRGLNDRKSAKDLHPKPMKQKDLYFHH